jgi:hypothetical protein
VIRCLRVGFCKQGGEPSELAQRVIGDLVVVHRGAPPERGAVGGLAERAAGGGLGFVDLEPFIFVDVGKGKREMRRDGSGQHCGWFGFAEPGQHRGGAPSALPSVLPAGSMRLGEGGPLR